jgi:uncharacterized membrane protein
MEGLAAYPASVAEDSMSALENMTGETKTLRRELTFMGNSGEGAAWGGFWGLLIGATLAIPFTAAASLWKDEFGISDEFVQQVGGLFQPGDSEIYAILRVGNPDVVADQFRGYGGTILRTTLSRDQQTKVEKVLGKRGR